MTTRSPLIIGLCMRNLAHALKNGTISGSMSARVLSQLAEEVEGLDPEPIGNLSADQAVRIMHAIRREESDGQKD